MKVKSSGTRWEEQSAPSTDHDSTEERFECEHTCWDPKDGELCLNRTKPGETLVEVRSDSNVQFYQVKRMIRGIRGGTSLTYSQTLNG
jgi:hypothetical protein